MSDNNFEQAYEGLDNNEGNEYVYENENNLPQNNNNNGKNANTLRKAIERNNANAVTTFINSGQEISVDDLRTAATKASYATNDKKEKAFEILRKLLDNKNQNPSLLDEIINNIAGSTGKYAPDVLGLLVEKGGELSPFGKTPAIYNAIVKGSFETFVKCVELGARIDKVVNYPGGWPPIYAAVEQAEVDKVKKVKYLLDKKVNISYVNKIYDNLLITAIRIKEPEIRMEVCKLFLANPSLKADFQNFAGKTALMMLVDENLIDETNIQLLKLFLNDRRFIDALDRPDKNNKNIFDLVALNSSLSPIPHDAKKEDLYDRCINIIVSKACGLNRLFCSTMQSTLRNEGTSLLRQAILTKNIEFIKLFLQYRVGEVNYSFQDGYSPLTLAIKEKSIPIIEALLQLKAFLDEKNSFGITPLVQAYLTNDKTIIDYITAAYPKYLKRKPTKEEYSEILFGLAKEPSEINYDEFFTSTGINPTTGPKLEGKTLLMIASEGGNYRFIEYLLEKGANPEEYQDLTLDPANPLHRNAYDFAKKMGTRLLLVPHMEKDKPRFKGFIKKDFNFKAVFDDLTEFCICPFCFIQLEHGAGCMYIFEHNCGAQRTALERMGAKTLPIIHEKLYKTYRDNKQQITVCHHCNRAGYTFPQGELFVGHQHIQAGTATPFVKPVVSPRNPYANYYDRTGCFNEGGGSHSEKIQKFQTLSNFMCFLNEHFIGKISNNMAHLMCREVFWESSLDYLTKEPFHPYIPDKKFDMTLEELDKRLREENNFILLCEPPEEVEEVKEVEENVANVPRYGTNEVDLAPVEVTEEAGERDCFIQTQINLDDPHGDGRTMWGFKHRQRGLSSVYDHYSKKEYVCGPCLERFLNDTFMKDKVFTCFNPGECNGHFHPSELKGKISDQLYEQYKKSYNKNPPALAGGSRGGSRNNVNYPPLLGPSVFIKQNSCPIKRRGGGYKKSRKMRRKMKTRKNRKFMRTRKH